MRKAFREFILLPTLSHSLFAMHALLISTDITLCLLRARFNESKCARIWSAAKNSRFAFVLGFPKLGESPKEFERSARGVLMSLSLCVYVITSALKHIRAREVLVLL